MKKKIKILFGEMGAGKNYWGEALARGLGVEFFDGDTVVPPLMMEKVSKFKPIQKEVIVDYIFYYLLPEIVRRAERSQNLTTGLVVAQALYDNEDRRDLSSCLEANGFEVEYYWIKTSFWKNIKQIFSRKKGLRWVIYWLLNKPFFNKPTHNYFTIEKISLSDSALMFRTRLNIMETEERPSGQVFDFKSFKVQENSKEE